ncbi:MAG: RteC domain-containing protein [Marinilabiliaceae bacterium]|nr:RteC domain-containing protein [Marinilabiliaceae bacterium]
MEFLAKNLFTQLQTNLQKINEENISNLKRCEKSAVVISNTMHQLRQWVLENSFQSDEQEIFFFKVIKPKVFSQLIYHVDLFKILTKLPEWSEEEMRLFLMQKIKKINRYRAVNLQLYQYLQNDLNSLDDRYFLRAQFRLIDAPDALSFDCDPRFTTVMDYKVARFKADEMLMEFINQKLNTNSHNSINVSLNSQFHWTESKVALTELIYAIHTAGCINNGNVELKDIALYLQDVFCIDLGNFYNDFKQIKNRNNPTKFIDHLKEAINQRIAKQDELV